MDNLTKEEIIELFERCGLRWFWNHNPNCHCGEVDDDDSVRSWHYKNGDKWELATQYWHEQFDPNNIKFMGYLFKYATIHVAYLELKYAPNSPFTSVKILDNNREYYGKDKDPAIALFRACQQVFNDKGK